MRAYTALLSLLILISLSAPSFAQGENPEKTVGNMATKLTRGVTNIATSFVEIPKQSILSIRDQGAVGLVIGPLKGVGMTVYRTLLGCIETAFFLVPQPGHYDPMTDPDYVWNGWEKEQPSNYVKATEKDRPDPEESQTGE
jgi:putative exosortase-associated protein (TIGR04073 family)